MGAPQVRHRWASALLPCTCSRAMLLTQQPDTIQQSSWSAPSMACWQELLLTVGVSLVPLLISYAADLVASHM